MDIRLEPGSYVVAVSGGVDSSALLHHLYFQNWKAAQEGKPTPKLVVAHFDHGTREDSDKDRVLVQSLAKAYGLPFVYAEGKLGADTSEAKARKARYEFLRQVQKASEARAIITAHHQDDLMETAIINMIRGTGRRGLTSITSHPDLHRPALHLRKEELIDYAKKQGLKWREDSTNADTRYLRNHIRHNVLPKFDEAAKQKLRQIIVELQQQNQVLDHALINVLHQQSESGKIDRRWFNHLPHIVAKEVMATWLRAYGWRQIDRRKLEKLVVAAKVAKPGKLFPLFKGHHLQVGDKYLALTGSER
jgi:tRNA(Ile)-lysidine synthase